jgi:signal transduction histidine kinase
VLVREREASVVAEVREQERLRIARSLHDSIGRHLAIVHIYGTVLQHPSVLTDQEFSSTSTELLRATDGIADDLKKILTMLHPRSDAEVERPRDLPLLLSRFEHAAGLASMTLERDVDLAALSAAPAEVAATIVDFLGECTTNVLKYGSEGKVSIVVSMRTPTVIQAQVVNPRSHISRRSIISTGMGLIALRERAALLDGELSILSDPTRFSVALALPVDR